MSRRKPSPILFASIASIILIGAIFGLAPGGVQPSVGLYYTSTSDPTIGPGQAAPLWQLLIRTDDPSIYYKSGTSNNGWTKLGEGTGGGGGTVTSVDCLPGLTCTPDPIIAAGTIGLNLTTTTCAAGQAEVSTASDGTSACAVFVNAAGTGLQLTGSSLSLNITPTTCAAGQAEISTAANGTSTCAAFVPQASLSGTANTIAKFTSTTAVGNSSVTDDGTTWAINTNKVTVTEASGNTSIAGTLGVTGLTTATGGINSSGGVTTVGQLIGTVQTDTSTGTVTDFSLTATTTTLAWNGASAATINGITGGASGRRLVIINISNSAANTLTIGNESGTAANRTRLAGGASVVLTTATNGSAGTILEYNTTTSRWMEIARTNTRYDSQVQFQNIINLGTATARITDSATGPALTSCGGSPTVSTGEGFFSVTTGSAATGCVATFGGAFTATPSCNVTSRSGVQPAYTVSTTAVTLGTGTTASTIYDISCYDH